MVVRFPSTDEVQAGVKNIADVDGMVIGGVWGVS